MNNSSYSVRILQNGSNFKQYFHKSKTYIESKIGSEYEIEVSNHSYSKILAVISVDGINVVSGNIAKKSNKEAGYVINGNDSLKIKGYRKSNDEVGAFKFCKKEKSYSKEVSGDSENTGCIGVLIFKEKVCEYNPPIVIKEKEYVPYPVYPTYPIYPKYPKTPHWWYGDYYCGDNTSTGLEGTFGKNINVSYSCSTDNQKKCLRDTENTLKSSINSEQLFDNITLNNFDTGSTWGSKLESKVIDVVFDAENTPDASFCLYYASRQSLIKMGVPMVKEVKISFPEPFKEFAKPPSGWK